MFWIFKLSISAIKIRLEGNPHVLKLSPGPFTYVVQFNFHKASLRWSHFTETQEKEMEVHSSSCRWSGRLCDMPAVPMTWGQL